jgi:FkbM family methyltransferase
MGLLNTLSFILEHPLNRSDKFGALARYVKWQVGSRILPGHAVVDFVDDMKLVVSPGMSGATGNLYCGLHEYEDMAFALHLLRPGDLFIDVGANVGSYSVLAAAAGAEVLAFEPGERYVDLVRNMAINHIPADCRRDAVGSAPGILSFTVGLDAVNRAAMEGESSVEVPVVRLDDVVKRPATLIKVDVEGFEGAVVAGGMKAFGAATAVIMELNGQTLRYGHDERQIRDLMAGLGYTQTGYDPSTRQLKPAADRDNSIFVRQDFTARLRDARQYRIGRNLV